MVNLNVNVTFIAIAPLEQFLKSSRDAVTCSKTPTHWNRNIFSACLKQSDVLALVTPKIFLDLLEILGFIVSC